MESLYLLYNGEKIVYYKLKNGEKGISLPLTTDGKDRFIRNTISRDSIGWKLSSEVVDAGNEFSNVWMTDEGKIGTNSSSNQEIKWLEETVDPNKKSEDPVYLKAQKMFDVLSKNLKTIIAYERIGLTPEHVVDLRKQLLDDYLRLLGYNSISDIRKKEEPTGEYASLARVGKKLESYKTLAFVRRENGILNIENYLVKLPELLSPETGEPTQIMSGYKDRVQTYEDELQENASFFQQKDDMLERSRYLSPDYFQNMRRKITPEEWRKYNDMTIRVGRLIMGLNYDLIPKEEREKVEDLTGLSQLEVEDKISQVIDDRSFDEAADIENKYAIAETQGFSQKIDEFSQSTEELQQGQLAMSLQELKDEATSTRQELTDKRKKYSELSKMYEKAKKIIIKGDNTVGKEK